MQSLIADLGVAVTKFAAPESGCLLFCIPTRVAAAVLGRTHRGLLGCVRDYGSACTAASSQGDTLVVSRGGPPVRAFRRLSEAGYAANDAARVFSAVSAWFQPWLPAWDGCDGGITWAIVSGLAACDETRMHLFPECQV
jgi:hypothetical protein